MSSGLQQIVQMTLKHKASTLRRMTVSVSDMESSHLKRMCIQLRAAGTRHQHPTGVTPKVRSEGWWDSRHWGVQKPFARRMLLSHGVDSG
jgi:hypothetical protein